MNKAPVNPAKLLLGVFLGSSLLVLYTFQVARDGDKGAVFPALIGLGGVFLLRLFKRTGNPRYKTLLWPYLFFSSFAYLRRFPFNWHSFDFWIQLLKYGSILVSVMTGVSIILLGREAKQIMKK